MIVVVNNTNKKKKPHELLADLLELEDQRKSRKIFPDDYAEDIEKLRQSSRTENIYGKRKKDRSESL